nr:glycosyltransferase [Micromonospora sp. DSM 115978]
MKRARRTPARTRTRGRRADDGRPAMRVVALLKTGYGCWWTAPLLDALCEAGHEVVVLLPTDDSPLGRHLRESTGVSVRRSPAPIRSRSPLRQITSVVRLRRLLRELDPDVVHYHLYAAALTARAASVGLPAARVHMVAGPLYLENRLIELVERVLMRADDLIVCS